MPVRLFNPREQSSCEPPGLELDPSDESHLVTFGREPVYVRAAELPPQLAGDPCLRIETSAPQTSPGRGDGM